MSGGLGRLAALKCVSVADVFKGRLEEQSECLRGFAFLLLL